MIYMKRDLKKQNSGFTLIEMMVSVSLFIVVLTIAVGTLLVLIDANGKAQNMQEAMTNLTFALDSMTREIRTGRSYFCSNSYFNNSTLITSRTRDCAYNSPGVQLSFVEGGESLTGGASGTGADRISYRFYQNRIWRQVGRGAFEPLTSTDIVITDMFFVVTGTDTQSATGDVIPPSATLYIEGKVGDIEGIDTHFEMETTVAQRTLDI